LPHEEAVAKLRNEPQARNETAAEVVAEEFTKRRTLISFMQ
jgi:hypothetical protein